MSKILGPIADRSRDVDDYEFNFPVYVTIFPLTAEFIYH